MTISHAERKPSNGRSLDTDADPNRIITFWHAEKKFGNLGPISYSAIASLDTSKVPQNWEVETGTMKTRMRDSDPLLKRYFRTQGAEYDEIEMTEVYVPHIITLDQVTIEVYEVLVRSMETLLEDIQDLRDEMQDERTVAKVREEFGLDADDDMLGWVLPDDGSVAMFLREIIFEETGENTHLYKLSDAVLQKYLSQIENFARWVGQQQEVNRSSGTWYHAL